MDDILDFTGNINNLKPAVSDMSGYLTAPVLYALEIKLSVLINRELAEKDDDDALILLWILSIESSRGLLKILQCFLKAIADRNIRELVVSEF